MTPGHQALRHIAAGVLGGAFLAISVFVPVLAPVLTPIGGTLLLATGTALISSKPKGTP